MAIKDFSLYLIKLKQLQNHHIVLEQMSISLYYKANNWSVKRDKITDFTLDKDTKEVFFEKEWNYKLPENYKYNFMKLNDFEYYKDMYIYYENMIYRFKQCNKYDFPENVKIDYFTFSLYEIYSYQLDAYNMKHYIVGNTEHWINSYRLVDSLDRGGNYRTFITKIHKPEQMYQYFRNIENTHNEKVKNEIWNWKKTEDTKRKFIWMMKLIRKKHKIIAYNWMNIHTYLF
jgi:hypothetical protein